MSNSEQHSYSHATASHVDTAQHTDVSIREKTTAVAEVPARGSVVAEARVETKAGEKFADAADEHRRAAEAAAAKATACAEASAANPSGHAKAAFGDLGTKISASREVKKQGRDEDKHEGNALSEEQRAYNEEIQAKEKARMDAIREAEAKAAITNRSTVVSEYATAHEIVAVAEVPARGATLGTGVAESHADDHLVRATHERRLAAEAGLAKEAAEARLATAHPGQEAKDAVGGIGTKIHAKMHEAKEWMNEKMHSRHATSKEADAEATLQHDMELARAKAKQAAEAQAALLDRNAAARVIDEHTTTSTVVNATHA